MRGRPLTPKRTEYGKEIRKAYEAHVIEEKRANIQRLEPRNDGICNTITTIQKDSMYLGRVIMDEKKPKILNPEADKVQELIEDEKELDEEAEEGKTIEDYLYTAKDGEKYGIFKLSVRECGRLMDVTDEDISKMMAVNSNTQCYKQFGNSIVVVVLAAIFSQLHIKGIKPWNERTDEERRELLALMRKGDKHKEA